MYNLFADEDEISSGELKKLRNVVALIGEAQILNSRISN